MKLNLGCGSNRIPGWQNHDNDVDVTKPLPFKTGSAEFILIEHCLEHVSAPDGFRFMREAQRVLAPGGVLRICVPHLHHIKDPAHAIDLILGHGHMVVFTLEVLINLLQLAGFETVTETGRRECDGHHKVIGLEKDDLETLRVEATKANAE